MTTTTTNRASMTIGTVPGYFHGNQGTTLEQFCAIYQKVAAEVMESAGLYISAVVNASKCVYHTDWGCPSGGEDTFTVTATRNPAFASDAEAWKKAFLQVANRMKEELKQSTVSVEFSDVDFVYLA